MALTAGYSAVWSDINAIYNNLRTAQSKHGLTQTAIPGSQTGASLGASTIADLNNRINALRSERHIGNNANTGVSGPYAGNLIRASDVARLSSVAATCAGICHHNSFNPEWSCGGNHGWGDCF